MMVLYQQLYGMAAMSAMDAKIEEQIAQNIPDDERDLLTQIYESNDLDERQALIALRLGYLEQALYLRTRVEQKRSRPAQTEPFSDFLE